MKSSLVKLPVIFLAVGLIFSYSEMWGADWKLYTSTPNGEFFYDSKSIYYNAEDNFVRVVSKVVYSEKMKKDLKEKQGKAYENVTHNSFTYEFDCKDKKYRLLEINIWSGENLLLGPIPIVKGGPIDSGWQSFAKFSPLDFLYEAVCK